MAVPALSTWNEPNPAPPATSPFIPDQTPPSVTVPDAVIPAAPAIVPARISVTPVITSEGSSVTLTPGSIRSVVYRT
jgi:hypothetical protein